MRFKEYKFERVRRGIVTCVVVSISVDDTPSLQLEIRVAADVDKARKGPEIAMPLTPEQVSAAITGLRRMAEHLFTSGKVTSIGRISITAIECLWPDSNEDAIECAAAITLFKAFLPDDPELEVFFSDHWEIKIWNE